MEKSKLKNGEIEKSKLEFPKNEDMNKQNSDMGSPRSHRETLLLCSSAVLSEKFQCALGLLGLVHNTSKKHSSTFSEFSLSGCFGQCKRGASYAQVSCVVLGGSLRGYIYSKHDFVQWSIHAALSIANRLYAAPLPPNAMIWVELLNKCWFFGKSRRAKKNENCSQKSQLCFSGTVVHHCIRGGGGAKIGPPLTSRKFTKKNGNAKSCLGFRNHESRFSCLAHLLYVRLCD